jgi:hypothetical protein
MFTVTQEGHPKLGQEFILKVWTSVKATTNATSTRLKGAGAWPVTSTSVMAEDPSFEFSDVPYEERIRFCEFIGDGNGPAGTIGTWEMVAKLPGLDETRFTMSGCQNETLGDIEIKREGSEAAMGGPMLKLLINGIDPIEQTF